MDKPSQSWRKEGGGGDSKRGRLHSELNTLKGRRQAARAALRLQLTAAETWSLLCPNAAKLKTTSTQWAEEEKNKERNVFHVRERGESTGLIFYRGRLEEKDQGRAWGYYRSRYHGNQNLEADARTTGGGRAPLTGIPDTFPSRFAPWREVHGPSRPSMIDNFNPFQTVWACSQHYQLATKNSKWVHF